MLPAKLVARALALFAVGANQLEVESITTIPNALAHEIATGQSRQYGAAYRQFIKMGTEAYAHHFGRAEDIDALKKLRGGQ